MLPVYTSPCLETAPRRSLAEYKAERLNLRCRCGADGRPIPCKGGCGFICQRIERPASFWGDDARLRGIGRAEHGRGEG